MMYGGMAGDRRSNLNMTARLPLFGTSTKHRYGNYRSLRAGELGFEPRLKESESFVLPLHYSPSARVAALLAWLADQAGGTKFRPQISCATVRRPRKPVNTGSFRRSTPASLRTIR